MRHDDGMQDFLSSKIISRVRSRDVRSEFWTRKRSGISHVGRSAVTSRSTKAEDLGEKKGLYAFLGVKEYVIFDPLEEYLEPRLRLYRLSGEEYLPVVGNPIALETVNLELHVFTEVGSTVEAHALRVSGITSGDAHSAGLDHGRGSHVSPDKG